MAGGSPASDVFTRSEKGFGPVTMSAAPQPPGNPVWKSRKAAAVVLLAVSGTIGAIACWPGSHAGPVIPVGKCWTQGQIIQGPCSERLSALTEDGQQMYRGMPLGLKEWFADNVNGKAGPLGIVNKRDAFINGKWAGFDVFDFVNGRLDKKAKELDKVTAEEARAGKKMSAEDIQRGKEINQTCRSMTQQQRKAFVELLDLDTGRLTGKK